MDASSLFMQARTEGHLGVSLFGVTMDKPPVSCHLQVSVGTCYHLSDAKYLEVAGRVTVISVGLSL